MSDFDKEAERERLREQYERDKKKREVAERMSELLLKGATMTNAHCSVCGDPIFRYDGQEFCATCERPVDREGDGHTADEDEDGKNEVDSDEESETSRNGAVSGGLEVTTPRDDARVTFGGEDEGDHAGDERADEIRTEEELAVDERAEDEPTRANEPVEPADSAEASDADTPTDSSSVSVPGIDPADEEDLVVARQSIVSTLVRFSRRAESASDPQEAIEYLRAAREAAETLAALRQ